MTQDEWLNPQSYKTQKTVKQELLEEMKEWVKELRKQLLGEDEAPKCFKHKSRMRLVMGQYGEYWSCTNKDYGNWCKVILKDRD